MVGIEMQQMDLREVIADGLKQDKDVGGYLMRYTFLDQALLREDAVKHLLALWLK